jgi:predicted nucleic acid-binding protein
MSDDQCYYFDTNVLFKHYVSKETEIRRLSSTSAVVYVSNLTYLEVLGVLMRYFRQGKLRKRQIDSILDQLKRDIGTTSNHRFQLVSTQEGVFRNARKLIIEYAMIYELSTNDALHIAIAKTLTPVVIMVTSDGGKSLGKMKGVCAKIGLGVFDPEISSRT